MLCHIFKEIYCDFVRLFFYSFLGMAYLEFGIEGIQWKSVVTNSTCTIDMSLKSIKAFIFNPIDISCSPSADKFAKSKTYYSTREIEQVMFISGPEKQYEKDTTFVDR